LAAGAAGLAGDGGVGVGDGYGEDAGGGAVFGDGAAHGVLFGAVGEAVACVFNVAAGDDGSVVEEECCAYVEVAVGSVCV